MFENSTGGKSGAIQTSDNPFETSRNLSGLEYMIRECNQKWEEDYVRKTTETLQAQTDRSKIAHEKNAQRADIDETMGEGGGDEEEDGESEDDDEDGQGTGHDCVQSVRKNIREDMEDRWVTNLSEDRKRFYLVTSQLDPRTKMLSFCDNKYFPSS